jgi:hypothetical protein
MKYLCKYLSLAFALIIDYVYTVKDKSIDPLDRQISLVFGTLQLLPLPRHFQNWAFLNANNFFTSLEGPRFIGSLSDLLTVFFSNFS